MEPIIEATFELTTRQAAERYGCGNNYSTFHNRMAKLGIKPERRGRQSFLNQEQIQLLDLLDNHLKAGGTFGNFAIETGEIKPLEQKPVNNVSLTNTESIGNSEILSALKALAAANYDVLTPQKCLKEAVDNGFILTSEQVGQIIGLSGRTIAAWKSGTKKMGFTFYKEKEGSSVMWRVE